MITSPKLCSTIRSANRSSKPSIFEQSDELLTRAYFSKRIFSDWYSKWKV